MKVLTRRCECVWCRQIFYSDRYYKFGTCSGCLISKVSIRATKLAEILEQAEREAIQDVRKKSK